MRFHPPSGQHDLVGSMRPADRSVAGRKGTDIRRRRFLAFSLAVAATGVATSVVRAEDYPARAVTLVVPFTPGGSTDFLGRVVGDQMAHGLGQPVVIDNRPGAGGSVGSAIVAKADPDGYTLLLGHIGALAFNPSLYPKLPYNPVADFAPISMVARLPNVLVVHPSVPANSVAELIDHARQHPGELNHSSGGKGSAAHIAMAAFAAAAGLDLVHVPYKGTAPGITDLIGGRVHLTMTGGPAVLPFARESKLRALAVSSATRLTARPSCRPSPRRPCRVSRLRSGTGSWRRPGRLTQACSGSTPRCAVPWPRPSWWPSWPTRAPSRGPPRRRSSTTSSSPRSRGGVS